MRVCVLKSLRVIIAINIINATDNSSRFYLVIRATLLSLYLIIDCVYNIKLFREDQIERCRPRINKLI